MLPSYFVIIGVILNAIAVTGYIIDTLKGKIQPNRVTFFCWSLAPFLAFAAQRYQGVGIQSLLTFSIGFFPVLILIATFFNKKSIWKLTFFDFFCGFLSILGLTLWMVTKVGNIAILFAIIADFFGAVPTMVKAYKHPESELAWAWGLPVINGVLTLLTIKTWTFQYYAFPAYFTMSQGIIYFFAQFKIGKKS